MAILFLSFNLSLIDTLIIKIININYLIEGETVKTVSDFIWGGAPKSLQMVIAAMKLKDAYSLEGKL